MPDKNALTVGGALQIVAVILRLPTLEEVFLSLE